MQRASHRDAHQSLNNRQSDCYRVPLRPDPPLSQTANEPANRILAFTHTGDDKCGDRRSEHTEHRRPEMKAWHSIERQTAPKTGKSEQKEQRQRMPPEKLSHAPRRASRASVWMAYVAFQALRKQAPN